jgi:hypothetical protein
MRARTSTLGQSRHDFDECEARLVTLAMRERGLTLHCSQERPWWRWWLSNGQRVTNSIAQLVISDLHIVGVGDTLFDGACSQTFRHDGQP